MKVFISCECSIYNQYSNFSWKQTFVNGLIIVQEFSCGLSPFSTVDAHYFEHSMGNRKKSSRNGMFEIAKVQDNGCESCESSRFKINLSDHAINNPEIFLGYHRAVPRYKFQGGHIMNFKN